MADRPPFDPAPRPGEVGRILARARRRRGRHAVVPAGAVALSLVALAVASGGTSLSRQQLDVADPPGGRRPASSSPGGAEAPRARPGTRSTPPRAGVPGPLAGSPAATARPSATPRPPGGTRPYYTGELGPRIVEYGYPGCRQLTVVPQELHRAVLQDGFCVGYRIRDLAGAGDLAPALEICWAMDTPFFGSLEYPAQEETDLTLFSARVDDSGRVVPRRALYRFSDTVRYRDRAHTLQVLQGDCYRWEGHVHFDPARHRDGDRFVLRFETRTTEFGASARRFDLPFSAGRMR